MHQMFIIKHVSIMALYQRSYTLKYLDKGKKVLASMTKIAGNLVILFYIYITTIKINCKCVIAAILRHTFTIKNKKKVNIIFNVYW